MTEPDYSLLRNKMVEEQLRGRGLDNERLLSAFKNIPRELFVPKNKRHLAYNDHPIPIGLEQTISQPYIVALMTDLLAIEENDKILEIGTGSGYQAAVLAYLGADTYSIERHVDLANSAASVFKSLNFNIKIKVDDGTLGWLQHAPFDKIIVTAAAYKIPPELLKQLRIGGRMVIPVGGSLGQDLILVRKISQNRIKKDSVCGCIFVPLVGKYDLKN